MHKNKVTLSNPHVQLHQEIVKEIQSLKENIQNTNVNINDMLYHFFHNILTLNTNVKPEILSKLSKEIVQTALEYENIPWSKHLSANYH